MDYNRLTTQYLNGQIVATQKKTLSAQLHWHEFYEIELVLSGEGSSIINGENHELSRGSLTFLTPVDFHAISAKTDIEVINIMFTEKMLDDTIFAALLELHSHYTFLSEGPMLDRFISLCDIVIQEHKNRQLLSAKYTAIILECIIIEILRIFKSHEASIPMLDPIRKALLYVQIHFREPITLVDVANYSCLSSNYLSVKYHNYVGTTFQNHLIQLRVNYAAKMLIYSNFSITQICYASGFNNSASFFRAFKKYYGISPSEYRTDFKDTNLGSNNSSG